MTATNTIPDDILSFVSDCVDEYDSHSVCLEQVYLSKVTGQYAWGSGVVIKIEDAPMAKKYGSDRTEIRFNISDGSLLNRVCC